MTTFPMTEDQLTLIVRSGALFINILFDNLKASDILPHIVFAKCNNTNCRIWGIKMNLSFTDKILERLPRDKWNSFSLFISSLSFPFIGSPIRFSYRGFTIKEYDLSSAPEGLIREYFKFCYPADEIKNPEREFEIDRQYWPSAQTFIVTRNNESKIAGCMQLVHKNDKINLPVECSRKSRNGGTCEVDLPGHFHGSNSIKSVFKHKNT